MDDESGWKTALFAVVAGLSGVAGSFVVAGSSTRFIVAPIDAVVVRLSPAGLVTWMIQNVGEEAHLLHLALSFGLATSLLGCAALGGIWVAQRLDRPVVGSALAGLLAFGSTTAITLDPVNGAGAAVPVVVFTGLAVIPGTTPAIDPSGRRSLLAGAGAFVFVGLAAGTRWLRSGGNDAPPASGSDVSAAVDSRLQDAAVRSLEFAEADVPGLVSAIDEFYNVDITQFPPEVREDEWSMTITGAVDEDVTVTFADLLELPIEHRYVTLRCVSDEINGALMDTAVWTGTPIKPLLDEADPRGECDCAMLRAEDDYFVEFPVEALDDGFLAWRMNGRSLPVDHGYPVRILVPGHWGETNVKWLTEIELLDEEADGYWEERGWHGTGPVNTIAKLWGHAPLDDGRIELGGHAYAGTRGVERVEVSVDDGETWDSATLSYTLPGDDVWRQWRYVSDDRGPLDVVVRAVDGNGDVQPEEPGEPFPSGATGWVSERIER